MLRVKDEKELAKCGLVIDPSDPTMAVPIGQQTPTSTNGLPGNGNGTAHAGSEPSAKTETAQAAANVADSPIVVPSHSAPANGNGAHDTASFTRETLVGPVGDLSNLDDQAITTGMRSEGAAISAMDADPRYPARYHRLGKYIIESKKRFGEKDVAQLLRKKELTAPAHGGPSKSRRSTALTKQLRFPLCGQYYEPFRPGSPESPRRSPRAAATAKPPRRKSR